MAYYNAHITGLYIPLYTANNQGIEPRSRDLPHEEDLPDVMGERSNRVNGRRVWNHLKGLGYNWGGLGIYHIDFLYLFYGTNNWYKYYTLYKNIYWYTVPCSFLMFSVHAAVLLVPSLSIHHPSLVLIGNAVSDPRGALNYCTNTSRKRHANTLPLMNRNQTNMTHFGGITLSKTAFNWKTLRYHPAFQRWKFPTDNFCENSFPHLDLQRRFRTQALSAETGRVATNEKPNR